MAKMSRFEKIFVNSRIQYYLHKWFWFGRIVKRVPPIPYRNILEIGAGVGFTVALLAERYPHARIIATDFDEDAIAVARGRKHPAAVEFQQADATRLPFADNHFDAAFSVLTLHHIHDYEQAISELARVVKRGGDIYIMDIPSALLNFTHVMRSIVPGLFRKRDVIRVGERHGLQVEDWGGTYLFTLHGQKA